MKIIDRYLTKQLIFPILLCACTLIFLVFMANVFDYMDEMVKNKTSIPQILLYYTALIPETFVSIIPWASLLATIYVLTNLNYHNELTAMKVSGLEITSIIRPIIFMGFILGIVSFLVNDQIVPRTAPIANEILKERIQKKKKTPPQSQLKRQERLNNLAGAFCLKKKSTVRGKRILLVDDIFTTGSTINECAKILKASGAERVDFFTIARSQAL